MPRVKGSTESTLIERVQALTLYSKGSKYAEIEAVTGIKRDAFKCLHRRAKKRGYILGAKIQMEYVANGNRRGRPRNSEPGGGAKGVVVNGTTEEMNDTTEMYDGTDTEMYDDERMDGAGPDEMGHGTEQGGEQRTQQVTEQGAEQVTGQPVYPQAVTV